MIQDWTSKECIEKIKKGEASLIDVVKYVSDFDKEQTKEFLILLWHEAYKCDTKEPIFNGDFTEIVGYKGGMTMIVEQEQERLYRAIERIEEVKGDCILDIDKRETAPQQRENQQAGNGEAKQIEAQESPLLLPDGLHTDEAVKVFKAAIKEGYMTKQGDCYKWNKSNALLAYMCGRLYCEDSIEKSPVTNDLEYKRGYKYFPETAICTLFDVKNLSQSRRQMIRPPKGYTDIDKLF